MTSGAGPASRIVSSFIVGLGAQPYHRNKTMQQKRKIVAVLRNTPGYLLFFTEEARTSFDDKNLGEGPILFVEIYTISHNESIVDGKSDIVHLNLYFPAGLFIH